LPIYTLTELGRHFSVSSSALTQAKENVAKSSSPILKKVLQDLNALITKTYN